VNSIEPVEVYTTLSPSEAEIIKNMLVDEGIAAEVSGDTQGGFPGAIPEVSIMVHSGDADRARELIRSHQSAANREPGGS
jgi:Putative prokaryotic signal transducing protein